MRIIIFIVLMLLGLKTFANADYIQIVRDDLRAETRVNYGDYRFTYDECVKELSTYIILNEGKLGTYQYIKMGRHDRFLPVCSITYEQVQKVRNSRTPPQ